MGSMATGGAFEAYWLSTLAPGTPRDLVEHWRRYVLAGVERGRHIVRVLAPYLGLPGSLALDIGCGYGGTCIALAQAGSRVRGVDIDQGYLLGAEIWAKEQVPKVNVSLVQCSAEALPFPDASFDLVVCADLIEHVDHPNLVVHEISRVLKEDGIAYVSFPNRLSLRNLHSDPHYRMFGVSLLPKRLGSWYVTRFRERSPTYSVGRLPIALALRRCLDENRMRVVWQNPTLQRNVGVLTPLVRCLRDNTYPMVEWVLGKDSGD